MIRPTSILAMVAVLAVGPWSALPAAAAPPAQAVALCSGSPRGCALETNDWLREGATFPVTVIGNANARVQVVIYQVVLEDEVLSELRPISSGTEVITNSSGVARTEVAIPSMDAKEGASGWALVSVGGVEAGTDIQETVGQFVPFGARVPRILGDGYGDEKPAGATLELQITGVIPGTRFAVDFEDDGGIWQEATRDVAASEPAGTPGTPINAPRPDDVSSLHYTVPRGLASMPHKFRLRNVSDSAIAPLWLTTPTVDGSPQDRLTPFQPPPVGRDLSGANLSATHPQRTVVLAAGGIAAAALALTLVGAASGLRRRAGLR